MSARNLLLALSLFVLAGCAAYQPPTLLVKHPAHPEAMAAPDPPPSKTLSYGPSNIPSTQPASSMGQERRESRLPGKVDQHLFVGEGKVIASVESSNQLVLDHKEIKGLMGAMTMGYRVEPPSLLKGIKAGEQIRFKLDTQKKAIVEIEKLQK